MSNVFQQVGQQTRRDGRESADKKLERLTRERDALTMRKRDIEGRLSELEAKRKEEQANVFKRRTSHNDRVADTTLIEAKYCQQRSGLLKELNNVVEELAILKQSLNSVSTRHPGDEILLRIESLLIQILERISK